MRTISGLRLSDFDYQLPKSLIAQQPLRERSQARLLILSRVNGQMEHRRFEDLPDYLTANDCLVLNDTKVLRARLFGKKPTGGRVEVLLHKRISTVQYEALIKPSGRVRQGSEILFGENGIVLRARVLDPPAEDSGLRRIKFSACANLLKILKSLGRVPLPPYIDRPDTEIDRQLYQTIFARKEGAVASPTAGLHFDSVLLDRIKSKGVQVVFITLHVGYGTFQPVAVEVIERHRMHPEKYEASAREIRKLNQAIQDGKRIIACGTTVVRTLETIAVWKDGGRGDVAGAGHAVSLRPGRGETRLFIYPPYRFVVTGGLITNFHLPKTTLLMLVAAFAGQEKIFAAYEEAIRECYRFYSYGDAMLIV